VFSLSALESKLVAYVKDVDAASQPFDASSVPKVSREQAAQEVARTLLYFVIDSALIAIQGRARWTPLVALSRERRHQLPHLRPQKRPSHHSFNS